MSAIEIDNLSVAFRKDQRILEGLSLRVHPGEHISIIGSSGCGKTTLLRCISGKITGECGSVTRVKKISTIHQDLRLVPQSSSLQNVLHGALGRLSAFRSTFFFPATERQKALELINAVGLSHKSFCKVSELSGGERQRVAIARALMQDPEIILADEPVSSLDDVNSHLIMKLLSDLAKKRKITLISVLHNSSLAQMYADKVLLLEGGFLKEFQQKSQGNAQNTSMARSSLRVFEEPSTSADCVTCAHDQDDESADRNRKTVNYKTAQGRESLPSALLFALMLMAGIALYGWAFSGLEIAISDIGAAQEGLGAFLAQVFSVSWNDIKIIPWGVLGTALVETFQMALIGTGFGVIMAIPFSILAAKNTSFWFLRRPVKLLLNAVRTVPSLIWALLFVAAVGLGPLAGILALSAYSLGYLSKFFYEAIEQVNPATPEAMAEIGASGFQRFVHAIWPATAPAIVSSSVFMIEYNVRAASILGVVDAGGIGFYIKEFIDYRFFPAVLASLVMILVIVSVLDSLSSRIRSRLMSSFS
jgi:phosphonate transport system permease protein